MNEQRINYLKSQLLSLEYNKNNLESRLTLINNQITLINNWLREETNEDLYKTIQEFVSPPGKDRVNE